MGLHTLFLVGTIPAALLIAGGWWINSRSYPEPVCRRYRLILGLAAALILLITIAVSAWLTPPGDNQPLYPIAPLLGPSLLAALALILLNLPGAAGAQTRLLGVLIVLGLVVIGLLFSLRGEQSGVVSTVLISALVLVLAWILGGWSDVLAVALSLLVLLLLGWINLSIASNPSTVYPNWFQVFALLRLYALPGMAVALAAVLLTSGMTQLSSDKKGVSGSSRRSWSKAILRFGLAALLLFALAYTILWASIWDQTNDGLTGIWFTTQAILVSIGAGVLITFVLKGRQVSVALIFLLGAPLILITAFSLGWRISNLEITAGRAARLQRAVERFHDRYGWYPGSLDELTPRDMWWIPGPVILQGESWCYQGDQNYYRLGAYYRDFFSSPLSLRIYSQAGAPPESGWACGDNLAEMKARYDMPP